MSLRYMLLGLLTLKPRSGYTVHKRFFSMSRPALSQIYRTLSDMADEGLIEFDKIDQDKLPDQKVYSIKKEGEEALDLWLKQPQKLDYSLDPFLTQLWFSSRIDDEDVLNYLRKRVDEIKEQIKWCKTDARTIINKGLKEHDGQKNALYWHAGMDYYLEDLRARLRWTNRLIKQISTMRNTSKSARPKGKNIRSRKKR